MYYSTGLLTNCHSCQLAIIGKPNLKNKNIQKIVRKITLYIEAYLTI